MTPKRFGRGLSLDAIVTWVAFFWSIFRGRIVVFPNGNTPAMVCRKAGPLYKFKDRPSYQPISAWGYVSHFWEMRDKRMYPDGCLLDSLVRSGALMGLTFVRFRLSNEVLAKPIEYGIPVNAVNKFGYIQIYEAPRGSFFGAIEKVMLIACGEPWVYVTSPNVRGEEPERTERGLVEWARDFDGQFDLYLIPEGIQKRYEDEGALESFPILQFNSGDTAVVTRDGYGLVGILDILDITGVRVVI